MVMFDPPPPDDPTGVDWVGIGDVLRAPAITPESARYWGDQFAGFEAARKHDALSALAFRAWRRRWWRGGLRRGPRLFHLERAAAAQADAVRDAERAIGWLPMPLGAARGVVRNASRQWDPGEARADQWLVTLPLYERVRGCLMAVDVLAWPRNDPSNWFAATGVYDALGAEIVFELLACGEPVRVYATPGAWNRAGGAAAPGCCLLDWCSEFGRSLLHSSGRLVADNRKEALALHKRIDAARPRVQFVKPARRAVA